MIAMRLLNNLGNSRLTDRAALNGSVRSPHWQKSNPFKLGSIMTAHGENSKLFVHLFCIPFEYFFTDNSVYAVAMSFVFSNVIIVDSKI